jgi:hypothetical protein
MRPKLRELHRLEILTRVHSAGRLVVGTKANGREGIERIVLSATFCRTPTRQSILLENETFHIDRCMGRQVMDQKWTCCLYMLVL